MPLRPRCSPASIPSDTGPDKGRVRVRQRCVVAGLVPAFHVSATSKDVDARHEVYPRAGRRPDPGAGHDHSI